MTCAIASKDKLKLFNNMIHETILQFLLLFSAKNLAIRVMKKMYVMEL